GPAATATARGRTAIAVSRGRDRGEAPSRRASAAFRCARRGSLLRGRALAGRGNRRERRPRSGGGGDTRAVAWCGSVGESWRSRVAILYPAMARGVSIVRATLIGRMMPSKRDGHVFIFAADSKVQSH